MRAPLSPRYWHTWIGLVLMRLVALLPWRVQHRMGSMLGPLLPWVMPGRRRIVRTNLRLCFPELNEAERETLVRAHFRDLGAGLMETNWCWFGRCEQVARFTTVEGKQHLQDAVDSGRPVILLTAHFTTIETIGPILRFAVSRNEDADEPEPLADWVGLYRPHKNPVMEWAIQRARSRYAAAMVSRDDMRQTLRRLKKGEYIWYAPDQDYGRRNSVFAPFFGVPAATLTATSRLAGRTNALVVPLTVFRRAGQKGYRLHIEPALDDFPGSDPQDDATRVNAIFERWVRTAPSGYWWVHRRFKTRPAGQPRLYEHHYSALPKKFSAKLPPRRDIERILIIKWSALGDVVIATTVFEDIARAFPEAELHLNTMAPWDRLLADDPRFSKVFAVPMRMRSKPLREIWHWLRTVRAGRYDLVIDLQCNDRSRILIWLLRFLFANIPLRMGNQRLAPYNIAPGPMPEDSHAIERLRATLEAGRIPTPTRQPVLYPGHEPVERARRLKETHHLQDGRYAVFLPGCQAAGHLKRWGWRRYAALALALAEEDVDKVVLMGGPDEMEECRAIADACGDRAVDLCGQTELLDIVPLCDGARVIVANDTGTAHVASATGRPMVVICGPTDPRRVKPVGDSVVALQAGLFCRNCYRKSCTHHSCMMVVSPLQVLQAMRG